MQRQLKVKYNDYREWRFYGGIPLWVEGISPKIGLASRLTPDPDEMTVSVPQLHGYGRP